MDVVIYALGGGNGHFVRGSALGQSFAARGAKVTLLLPDRFAESEPRPATDVVTRQYFPETDVHELQALLEAQLCKRPPTYFVVDAFPAGLLGELSRVQVPRQTRTVWLRRLLQKEPRKLPPYLDAVVNIEPGLTRQTLAREVRLGPVIKLRETSAMTGSAPEGPCDVLLLPTRRTRPLLRRLGSRLRRSGVRVAVPQCMGESVAASGAALAGDFLRAKVVVGPAGYHLTYELQLAGVHHIALPEPKRFDDQRKRAERYAEVPSSPDELEVMVRDALQRGARSSSVSCVTHDALADVILSNRQN